jgi:UDP-glucose 4-epimerase
MATILVTGAAGFIGSHTCEHLVAADHRVIGLDNFRTGHRENLSALAGRASFHLATVDVTDAAALEACVADAKPHAIIHLAALVSVPESLRDPVANFKLNLEATFHVTEAARRHGVRRVVFASSAAVYGNATDIPLREETALHPLSPYGGAKLASESLLLSSARSFGFTARCLRYFNVFGPRQDPRSPYSGVISIFAEKMSRGSAPTIFGDGEQSRDFIFVRDVARANVLAATQPGLENGVTNICTGHATSLNHLAAAMQRLHPGAPSPTYAAARMGDIRHSVGAPARARTELNFSSQKSLEAGLAELKSSAAG